MAVYLCSGCRRGISISVIPGGNPVAKENSGIWARSWRVCSGCSRLVCDSCAPPPEVSCPRCSSVLEMPSEELCHRLLFPSWRRPETERDLPAYVANGRTLEERWRRLESDRVRLNVHEDNYQAFRRILEQSAGCEIVDPSPSVAKAFGDYPMAKAIKSIMTELSRDWNRKAWDEPIASHGWMIRVDREAEVLEFSYRLEIAFHPDHGFPVVSVEASAMERAGLNELVLGGRHVGNVTRKDIHGHFFDTYRQLCIPQ